MLYIINDSDGNTFMVVQGGGNGMSPAESVRAIRGACYDIREASGDDILHREKLQTALLEKGFGIFGYRTVETEISTTHIAT